MSWRELVKEEIRRNEKIAVIHKAKAEEAHINGNDEREEMMYTTEGMARAYINGVDETLKTIGYTTKYDKYGNIESIIGDHTQEYRIRYSRKGKDNIVESVVCQSGSQVQRVLDSINSCSAKNPDYKFTVGIDSRIVYPNGEVGEWNKIFDF